MPAEIRAVGGMADFLQATETRSASIPECLMGSPLPCKPQHPWTYFLTRSEALADLNCMHQTTEHCRLPQQCIR